MEHKTELIFLLFILLVVAFSSCNIFPKSFLPQYGEDSTEVLEDISTKLQEKPVLITFGSDSCGACQQQDIVLGYLENKYIESVYFVHIDVDEHPRLAGTFGVYLIPDTSVIVMEEDGQFLYMGYDGNVSTDRLTSRAIGLTDADALSSILDMSIDYRKSGTVVHNIS
ncbi:thioredoxin family protein [Methanohalophilus sp.]|uniref:thioredoxin family protein n=1 Tax=Methanohalophilus sp. TaxID=1966352 RepID=UPI002613FA3C|nr:thioredoxin family protein [Methanohalophilus sp.]MDK2892748.1 hypothetical protein [Methanohalophilus sp.]